MRASTASSEHLILVGGGHAHVQVLRAHGMRPLPYRITVVVDRSLAVYSGMVPGVVAGQYSEDDVVIDVRALARRVGAAVVEAAATRVDRSRREVHLEGRPPLRYDVASLDVGSTVAGTDLPGVREHAVPTRPIGRLLERIAARAAAGVARVVVVGGGAGGVELAACLRARLGVPTALLADGPLLGGGKRGERVAAELSARGVERVVGRAAGVDAAGVSLVGGGRVDGDLVVWVAGAAGLPWLAESGLPTDPRGFVWTHDTLVVDGGADLFAVGDCATPRSRPDLPKAGVYAVRAGPVLIDNLRRRAAGQPLRPYRPQTDFFSLLNLGDGRAVGTKWGFSATGAWLFRWKDRIDRQFMAKFQAIGPDGAPAPAFDVGMPPMPAMDDVPCGGCAAKVARDPLLAALDRLPPAADPPDAVWGLGAREDVVAVQHGGEVLVANVDAFSVFTDDPWLVGRLAALNAVSDLKAKGVSPRWAMAVVAVPEGDPDPSETLFQVLDGARRGLGPVALLGGHSASAPALSVGFTVFGAAPDVTAMWGRDGLRPGDRLWLSGPLGAGVLWRADMLGQARGPWIAALVARALQGHDAVLAALPGPPTAATDVTGFGLASHLLDLLDASGVGADLDAAALPAYDGALACLRRGLRSTAHAGNQRPVDVDPAVDPAALALLFDPQTCGPLLLGFPAGVDVPAAVCIGVVRAGRGLRLRHP